jgi:transposase
MTQNATFGGIDCGKGSLNLAVIPGTEHWDTTNTPSGHRDLIAWLAARGVSTVGIEASGGYERPVRDALIAAGMTVHVLDPARVRHFAKAKGQRAKTDAIDAAMIATFTAQLGELPAKLVDREREALADLVRMRRLLVDKRADLEKAIARLPDPAVALVAPVLEALRTAVATVDARLEQKVQAHETVATTVRVLQSAPGVGPVTAVALAALLPELGRISGAQAAALLGVAPYPDDSSQRHGKRQISGGREDARRALYMAALAAATGRRPGVLASFYTRLIAAGKPPKVALTACMRKLIVRLNAMLAHNQTWSDQPT